MEKLCRDQLIGKLVALFKGADQQSIDDAVAQAKDQLTQEAKQMKRGDLEKLFDAQIAILKDRGVPEQIVEIFQGQKAAVLKKASEMTFGKDNIPFLPVIPRTFRGPYDLMTMVRNGSKAGYTYFNPTVISDVVDAPKEPYYIYDVEGGESTLGKSPDTVEKVFKQQKRSPLTAAEVMALCVHTDVLSKHNVWACGSRYGGSVGVPDVCLDVVGWPRLGWDYANDSGGRWGSASCGSR